jgi:hypothetical protein
MSVIIGYALSRHSVDEFFLQDALIRKTFVRCTNYYIINNIIDTNYRPFLANIVENISYSKLRIVIEEYSNKSPDFKGRIKAQQFIFSNIKDVKYMYMGMNLYITQNHLAYIGRSIYINRPCLVQTIDPKLVNDTMQEIVKYNNNYNEYLSTYFIDDICNIIMKYAINDISIILIPQHVMNYNNSSV